MSTPTSNYQLHFFTLRLWQEGHDRDTNVWRGEVKNTTTGEVRYFRDWNTLVHLIPSLLDESTAHELPTQTHVDPDKDEPIEHP